MKTNFLKRSFSAFMAVLMVLSCWVWFEPAQMMADAAASTLKDHYLFAYFTGTSKEGQTIHLAVSTDGYNYTALRNNEPVIIPSKGVGNVRDPYIWYNEQDNYYYILATDLDFTDGGATYSNNSQSFIIWRSKDLVNWYDETFIDVSKMAHLIGDTRNMSAVWAPQVLWDGSAYVVYFTLACNATSWFDIVYLKTTDLMNPDAYYEFDYILGNGTGNGTDNGYGVIDADIIHNPGDGKYYLFYKTECNANELGTTNKGTSLKTIHYYVGDTPTGPFRNPGDTKWPNCGFSIFPNYNVSLEGCNSFFDNDGNLIMYVDEFEHTNYYTGQPEAYFHIAKSNGNDFTSWTYPNVNSHNINSLSPRHGSVVKITAEEYNRLLANSYNVSSSSYSAEETLKDHLVARFFTTEDVLWNDVVGQPNLASSTGITMVQESETGEWYAKFDTTNGGWAEIDFDSLFRKTNGLNYEDGFTITFSARCYPMGNNNSENNDRIYEIANIFGDQASANAYYTHYSPGGGGSGSYLGNYNGPLKQGSYDWLSDKDQANRDDGKLHDYIISYATGNVMVYCDGELVISKNRFTGATTLDASWYEALGSDATMRIGKSGWAADPLFKGNIKDLCIYDCSMSYYDAVSLEGEGKEEAGWVGAKTYNGITSAVPSFSNSSTSQMEARRGTNFSNILYTAPVTGTPSGTGENANPTHGDVIGSAATYMEKNNMKIGVYYSPLTVFLLDGKNPARMPVEVAGRSNNKDSDDYFYQAYPSNFTTTADNPEVKMVSQWIGWNQKDEYHNTIAMTSPDGYFGHNSSTSQKGPKLDHSKNGWGIENQDSRKVCFFAGTMYIDENNIDFGNSYYKKINLFWRIAGDNDGTWFSDVAFSDHDIYVIDFRPIINLRNTITEDMYNQVMNNSALCPALRQKYAAAVYTIRTLDPNNFGFAESPVTATRQLAQSIGEAVSAYEGVLAEIERQKTAGSYGHSVTEFPSREATCAVNGLTGGQYCSICGEVLVKQEVIAPLAHTFGAIFTENGVQYKQCSVCGVRIEYQASGVRYENLFSLNGWMDSLSYNNGNGVSGGATLSANSANGTITINNSNTGEAVTSTSGGTNREGTWDCYCIPVKGNRTYVVEFTVSGVQGEIHIFKYDINGNLTGSYGDTPVAGTNGTFSKEFTVNATTAYIELRFDCNAKGTATFSQIGVYSKESFDTFAKTTADARLGFYPGNDKDLCYPNPASGYTFDGWYTKSGMKVDNVYQFNNPTTIVYGKWIKAGYNVVYDSIFSFSDWAKSSCNQLWYGDIYQLNDDGSRGKFLERMVSKEGILADAENGTITITWDADNKNYSDTANKLFYQYCARTNLHFDNGNLYKIPVEKNTEYIIEYTSASNDGGKPNVCAYMPTAGTDENGKNMAAQESGSITKYALGTQYFRINTCAAEELILRFDNVQIGSTLTYSNIAVYEADVFLDHAKNITNREYRRYYPTEMGIGDVFEYIPERPGYVFETWMADTDGDMVGDFNMKDFDDTFLVEQNWHLFSVWKEKERVNVTFDNLIDFKAWNKSAGNGTVSNVTDTGMTITCNADAGEATSSSPYFAVEPGKQYKIDIDFEGNNWDVYIFFCNASGGWVDFADGPSNRYSANGSTGITADKAIFTAPNKSEVVKAQIRVDSNGSNNTVSFDNIRVYEYSGYNIDVSPVNKYVGIDETFGTLPSPKRTGYNFLGWYDADGNKYTEASVMTGNTTVKLHSEWEITSEVLVSDAYVLDFGLKAVFAPLDNDTILKKNETSYSISGVSTDGKTAGSSVKGSYGTFTVNGTAVEYVPTAVMNGKEIAYYHVTVGDKVIVGSMTVFPATVVYYEDDVTSAVKYTDGVAKTPDSGFENSGKWTTTGTSKLAEATQNLTDAIYGYDSAYNNADDTFSMGASHLVSVSKFNNPNSKYSGSDGNSWPVAEFTFAGTGFDLVSVISQETGAIEVRVLDADGKKVYDWIVDTYYGYTLDAEGKWVVDADSKAAIYQIPVIGRTDLPYGTYTVQVIPTYTSRLDHQKDGSYDFYLDAIRVYNPMSSSDIDAATVYLNNGEYVVSHQAIRDILVDAKSFGAENTNQVIYINPGVPEGTFEQYSKAGPKNEVYLAQGQSIAFNMTVSGFKPTSVQISAHAVDGTAGMKVVSGSSYSNTFSMTHKTTLYYSVPFTAADYWIDNGNGTYTLKNPIVISNTGDGLLSLCNIKVTTNEMASVEPLMFMMSDEDFDTAVNSAAIASTLSADDGALFVPDDMVSGTDADVVATGEDVLVTINTSAEVHALTVNGADATLVSVNEDGSKTWTYTYTADSRGEQTFTLVAYNADGFASEETTVTVDVQSKIEIFFNKVSNFFSMIVEFLDKLFSN